MSLHYLDPTQEPWGCPGRAFYRGRDVQYRHDDKIVCDTIGCYFEHVADPPDGVDYERHLRRDKRRCRQPSLRRTACLCNGTGRLGKPDVEVFQWGRTASGPGSRPSSYWRLLSLPNNALHYHGPYSTDVAALKAARKATS